MSQIFKTRKIAISVLWTAAFTVAMAIAEDGYMPSKGEIKSQTATADGRITVTTDGTVIVERKDGYTHIEYPAGSHYKQWEHTPGQADTWTKWDGTINKHNLSNGEWTATYSKGGSVTRKLDGTEVTQLKNGDTIIQHPNGTTTKIPAGSPDSASNGSTASKPAGPAFTVGGTHSAGNADMWREGTGNDESSDGSSASQSSSATTQDQHIQPVTRGPITSQGTAQDRHFQPWPAAIVYSQDTDANGTRTTELSDGTVCVEDGLGYLKYSYKDGSTCTQTPDGSKTWNYPDGRVIATSPSGAMVTTDSAGNRAVQGTNPIRSTIVNPDGSIDLIRKDGSKMALPSDAQLSETSAGANSHNSPTSKTQSNDASASGQYPEKWWVGRKFQNIGGQWIYTWPNGKREDSGSFFRRLKDYTLAHPNDANPADSLPPL